MFLTLYLQVIFIQNGEIFPTELSIFDIDIDISDLEGKNSTFVQRD